MGGAGGAGPASSSSSTGAGGGVADTIQVSLVDIGLYVDCNKVGLDALQGLVTVDFASSSQAQETVTVTSAKATIRNGMSQTDVDMNLGWSAANPGPADQIPSNGKKGVLYKAQPGAQGPAYDLCSLCPFYNGNQAARLDLTITWDHAGNQLQLVSTNTLIGCLN